MKAQYFFFKKDFIYLMLERGKGGRRGGRETLMWERNIHRLPLAHVQPGTGLHTRQVLSLGIDLVTFRFAGRHFTN